MTRVYDLNMTYLDGLRDGFIDGFMNNVPPSERTEAVKVLARKEAERYIKSLFK